LNNCLASPLLYSYVNFSLIVSHNLHPIEEEFKGKDSAFLCTPCEAGDVDATIADENSGLIC